MKKGLEKLDLSIFTPMPQSDLNKIKGGGNTYVHTRDSGTGHEDPSETDPPCNCE
jgi:hypothetical protein